MAFHQLRDMGELRIGLYVKLEGSWFSHPFPTNTFKIKSAQDLETIRNLRNVTILYDPDRSDSLAGEVPGTPETTAEESSFSTPPSVAEEGTAGNGPSLIDESAMSDILERRDDFQEFREHVRRVEGSYMKALGLSSEVFRQIAGGKGAGLKTADAIVTNLRSILQNPRTAMTLVDVMGGNGVAWGLSEHALNVCMFSLIIGRQMDLSPDEMQSVGLGALFHDVGYRSLPMKVQFMTAGMKVQADPEMLHHHPERGRQIMQGFAGITPSVLEVIADHHERLDGSGFPQGLGKDRLSDLTQIVMVADYFDELCNAPDPQTSLTAHAALSFFYRHVVFQGESAKFSERVVQALVQAIGVYPPGSLVELNDGFIGVVSAINFETPSRPIVLLYAPWLSRTDGMVVNLGTDARLDIKQALHPKDVDPNVLAYLSPRRMAMFVHATDSLSSLNGRKRGRSLHVQKR